MFRTAARTATRTARGLRSAQRVSRRNFNNKSTYSGSNKLLFVAAGLVPVTIAAILLQKKETPPPIEIYEVKLGRAGSGEDADEDDEDEDEEEEGEATEAVIIEEETSEPAEDTENAESTEAAGSQSAAYNPETGEINWDCPCLGGMADGPCGEEFKEAFACFVYSETEPKGIDCITKFQNMRNCFKEHPEHYKEELFEDEEAERDAEAGAIEILEVEPQAGEVVEIVDVVDGNGEVIAEIVEVVDVVDATEAPEAEATKVEEASSAESSE